MTNELKQQTLIYDEARKYRYQGDTTPEELAMMNGEVKAFFEAEVVDGQFQINAPADWQDW